MIAWLLAFTLPVCFLFGYWLGRWEAVRHLQEMAKRLGLVEDSEEKR
jgi:lipopolysaccharide biosynthesis regulator YciM